MACPVYLNNEVPWGQDMIGLSADKSLVYLFDSPTIIEQWTFPGNVQLSDIDAEVAMDDVGALGGGNGRACTLATNGKFYIAGFYTNPTGTRLQLLQADIDGTNGALIWTAATTQIGPGSTLITSHPSTPDLVYILHAEGSNFTLFSIDVTTGGYTLIEDLAALGHVFSSFGFQRYSEGIVFLTTQASDPFNTYDVWAYDVNTAALDAETIVGVSGYGIDLDGRLHWVDNTPTTAALQATSGTAVWTSETPCASAWLDGSLNEQAPYAQIVDPSLTVVYWHDGVDLWGEGGGTRWHVGKVGW